MSVTQAIFQWIRVPPLMAVLIFLSAGTFDYPAGWIFIGVFSICSATVTAYLFKDSPSLLMRRNAIGPAGEQQWQQKVIKTAIFILFSLNVIVPSIVFRKSLEPLSWEMALIGNAIVIAGFLLRFFVFRENAFASANIAVTEGQKVVSTGPYELVRHPMYLSVLISTSGVSIALGTCWGLLLVPILTVAIIIRLLEEERFLSSALNGYQVYCKEVPYRLFPRLW